MAGERYRSGIGAPRRLFDRSRFLINDRFHSYSVSADGKRFLMLRLANQQEGSMATNLIVVQNWFEELKRLVPTT